MTELAKQEMITIYHGSQKIINDPTFGQGNPQNDYGLGFYCTEHLELAKEWACTDEGSGYANKYSLDIAGLKTIDLTQYSILAWLAILLENRKFKISSRIASDGKDFILNGFLPKYKGFDVVIGYRADDSYFAFANAFLSNELPLESLKEAMALGGLGNQIVIRSRKAFDRLNYQEAIFAEQEIYYPRKTARDQDARSKYRSLRAGEKAVDATYLIDIMREDWNHEDPRLR